MPDNVAFCPGCGRRMWVPGQDTSRHVPKSSEVRTRAVDMSAVATPATAPVTPKDNLAAAAAYITFVPAIFFVLVEPFKRNRFVRFHAFQSIFLAVATLVLATAIRVLYSMLVLIPVLGYLLAWLASSVLLLGWVILWSVLLVKALQGEAFKLPWIGSLAEKV
jgi:uncharacterized membrane protein